MASSTIVLGLVIILAGAVGAFLGFKLFKLFLAFVAFASGFMLVINYFGNVSLVPLIVGLAVAVLCASLAFVFYKFAIFVAFSFLGANLGFWILGNFVTINDPLMAKGLGIVIGAFLGIILILLEVDRAAIVMVTALLGAYFIVVGIASLMGVSSLMDSSVLQSAVSLETLYVDIQKLNDIGLKAYALVMSDVLYTIIYIFFAVTGFIFQLKKNYFN